MTKITITSNAARDFDLENDRRYGNNRRCDYYCGDVHLICSEDEFGPHPDSDTLSPEQMNSVLSSIEIADVQITT